MNDRDNGSGPRVNDGNQDQRKARSIGDPMLARLSYRPGKRSKPTEPVQPTTHPRRLAQWLEAAFQVRPNEHRRVLLMFLYCTCIIAAGFIVGRAAASSLFLKRIDPAFLPWTYVATSAFVSLASFAYSRAAKNRRLDRTIMATMAVLAAVTVGFRLLLQAFPSSLLVMGSLFLFVELAGTLAIVQFWTLANETFTAREGKRLFPLIGAGGPVAGIAFGALVRSTVDSLGAPNLLYVMIGLFLATILIVSRLQGPVQQSSERRADDPKSDGVDEHWHQKLRTLLDSKYLLTIAALVVALSVVVVIVDYQWMMVARDTYAHDENALAAYFGGFYMYSGVVAFFFQFFFAGRLLRRYGLGLGLMMLPIVLFAASGGVALLLGGTFALTIATVAKGSDNVVRFSITNASTELLYQPIPAKLRAKAKVVIDGTLRPLAVALSGLSILLLSRYLDTRQLSYVVMGMLVAVFVLARRAQRGYTESLADTIRKRRLDLGESTLPVEESTLVALRKALSAEDPVRAYHALELLPFVPNLRWNPIVARLLSSESAGLRQRALEHLERAGDQTYAPGVRALFTDPDPEVRAAAITAYCALRGVDATMEVTPFLRHEDCNVRAAAVTALIRHGGLDGILQSAEALKEMVAHCDPGMREAAAAVLGAIEVKHFHQPLVPLLDDPAPRVELQAIEAAGAMQSMAIVPTLIDKLGSTRTAHSARGALAQFGPDIVPMLAAALENQITPRSIRLNVPRVMASIGTQSCLDVLMRCIEARDTDVRHRVVQAIARVVRDDGSLDLDRGAVERAVRKEVREYFETAAVLDEVGDRVEARLLGDALVNRGEKKKARVLWLLAVLWPDKPVRAIARRLESTDRIMQSNALELLDNIIDCDFKPALLAMLEPGSWSRKAAFGHDHDGGLRRHGFERRLEELLADGKGWVAACAAHQIGTLRLTTHERALQAITATTDPIVKEAAIHALEQLGCESGKTAEEGVEP